MNTPSHHADHGLRLRRDDAIDPAFEHLLDRALAAPEPPPALAGRILAHTRPSLAAPRTGVLARLGLHAPLRLAAAVALVGMLGVFTVLLVTSDPPSQGPIHAHSGSQPASPVVLSEQEHRELLALLAATDPAGYHAALLEQRLTLARASFADSPADVDDPVDALLDTFEHEWLSPEMLF